MQVLLVHDLGKQWDPQNCRQMFFFFFFLNIY